MHKILDVGGLTLGAVVSDIKGVSASAMVVGKPMNELLGMARGSLKNKREDLAASLEGDLSPRWIKALKKIGKLPTAKPIGN